MGALHGAGPAVVGVGDVRVDLAALQRRERELGRDGHERAHRERGDAEQAQHGQQDCHRARCSSGSAGSV